MYLLVDVQVAFVCTQFRILGSFLLLICDRQSCALGMARVESGPGSVQEQEMGPVAGLETSTWPGSESHSGDQDMA